MSTSAGAALAASLPGPISDAGNVVAVPAGSATKALPPIVHPPLAPHPVVVPAAGSATVPLGTIATAPAGQVVAVAAAGSGEAAAIPAPAAVRSQAAGKGAGTGASSPGSVTVTTLDPAVVSRFGGQLLGFQVERADPGTSGGDVAVSIDYAGLTDAQGGAYGERLQVVAYPGCAITTPAVPACRVGTPLPTRNDPDTHRVTAVVSALPAGVSIPAGAPAVPATAAAPQVALPPGTPPYTAQTPPQSSYAPAAAAAAPTSGARSSSAAASSGGTVFALSAGASSIDGNYTSTSIKPSDKWSVGLQTGSFDYSYPVPMPPATGGATPTVSFDYSSQRVDGYVANTNRQTGQLGVGWDMPVPFIERTNLPCQQSAYTGSVCWSGENAVISINGHTTRLIQSTADGSGTTFAAGDTTSFTMEQDPGYRVDRVYGYGNNVNGDGIGFYWRVTDTSGTQYFFGRENTTWSTATNSTLTRPVINANPGDPCYTGTPNSQANVCTMAYRWNLAYVVDPNTNIQTYRWAKNTYTYEPWPGVYWDYDGDGYLSEIDYGQQAATAKTTPARQKIVFATTWRCTDVHTACADTDLPGPGNASTHPDTPTDLICMKWNGSSWCPNGPPHQIVHYAVRMMTGASTYVQTGVDGSGNGTYRMVDTVYPSTGFYADPNDSTNVSLVTWGFQHYAGDWTQVPQVQYDYQMSPNRWEPAQANWGDNRPRLKTIVDELGGRTQISYGQQNACQGYSGYASAVAAAAFATNDCYYVLRGAGDGDFYNKYLVTQTQVIDRDGSPTQTTTYTYTGGAAWHADNDPVAPLNPSSPQVQQLWSDFRGYQTVSVQKTRASGTPATDVYTYFRGMNGDHTDVTNTSAVRSVSVTTAPAPSGTPAGAAYTGSRSTVDDNALRGNLYEHRVLDATGFEQTADQHDYTITTHAPGSGAPVMTTPWGTNTHPMVQVGEATTTTLFNDGGLPRNRTHLLARSYETTYGRVIWEQDGGDAGTGIGPSCTWTTWNTNTSAWILASAQRSVRASGTCGASEPSGASVIGRREFLYDGQAAGTVTAGNVTQVLDWFGPNGNVTSPNQYTASKYTYDSFGHVTGVLTPNNYAAGTPWATTAYDTSTGPVTKTTTTNELGHVTATTIDPGRGIPLTVTDANTRTTTLGYDAFGRLTSVQRPDDVAGSPSTTYSYQVNQTAPSMVSTTTNPGSGSAAITSYAYIDSLGRTYQTESPGPSAGSRIVKGTQYDIHGNPALKINGFVPSPMGTAGTPIANWYDPTFTSSLPSRTQTTFDELDRATTRTLLTGSTTVSSSSAAYAGQTTTTTPAANGSNGPSLYPTATTVDLYGRTVKTAIKRVTPSDVVSNYAYDLNGNLASITSPKGAVTSYTNDWLGRRTQTIDPDAGTSTADYYPNGAISHAVNAVGQETWTTLDALNRPTLISTGPSGSKVSTIQNTYDTVLKGTLASTSRYDGTDTYTEAYTYDTRYRPSAVTRTVPGPLLGGAAGTTQSWTTTTGYDAANRPTSVAYPMAADLAAETITTGYTGAYLGALTTNLAGAPAYVSADGYTNIGQFAWRIMGTANATGSVLRGYGYDLPTGRNINISAATPSNSATVNVQNDNYTYANTGDVTAIQDVVGNQRQCFTYDGLDRLTLAGTTASAATGCSPDMTTGPQPYKEAYSYDDDGNLTQLVRNTTPTASNTTTWTYGNFTLGSAALKGGPHAPTVLTNVNGSTTTKTGYSYDNAGRLTTKTDSTGATTAPYTWNSLGQLASVNGTANGDIYGPDGSRWVRKTSTTTGGTTTAITTIYLPGQEIKRTVLTGGTNSTTTTGLRYYSHGGETIATRTTATGLAWILADRQASAQIAVSAISGTATRDRYTPYGLNRATTTNTGFGLPTSDGSDRGWLNQTRDDNSGLDYLSARYYDPILAHFISTDPLNNPATPQAANPYSYANDNPTTLSDPTGLYTYIVQPRDNWYTIAALAKLSTANNWAAVRAVYGPTLNALRPYQRINIPDSASPATGSGGLPGSGSSTSSNGGTPPSTSGSANSGKPSKDFTKAHDEAVAAAIGIIWEQAKAAGLDIVPVYAKGYRIEGAAKKCLYGSSLDCSYGYADILFRDVATNTLIVWEVKTENQVYKAQTEALWYVQKLGQLGKSAVLGWSIGGPIPIPNGYQIYGPANGAIGYQKRDRQSDNGAGPSWGGQTLADKVAELIAVGVLGGLGSGGLKGPGGGGTGGGGTVPKPVPVPEPVPVPAYNVYLS